MGIEIQEDQKIVQRLMQTGLGIAVILMIAGVLLHLLQEPNTVATPLKLADLLNFNQSLATLLLGWGIFVLALTPAMRVGILFLLWLKARDWIYAGISFAVILTLILAVAVGQG